MAKRDFDPHDPTGDIDPKTDFGAARNDFAALNSAADQLLSVMARPQPDPGKKQAHFYAYLGPVLNIAAALPLSQSAPVLKKIIAGASETGVRDIIDFATTRVEAEQSAVGQLVSTLHLADLIASAPGKGAPEASVATLKEGVASTFSLLSVRQSVALLEKVEVHYNALPASGQELIADTVFATVDRFVSENDATDFPDRRLGERMLGVVISCTEGHELTGAYDRAMGQLHTRSTPSGERFTLNYAIQGLDLASPDEDPTGILARYSTDLKDFRHDDDSLKTAEEILTPRPSAPAAPSPQTELDFKAP